MLEIEIINKTTTQTHIYPLSPCKNRIPKKLLLANHNIRTQIQVTPKQQSIKPINMLIYRKYDYRISMITGLKGLAGDERRSCFSAVDCRAWSRLMRCGSV